MHYIDRSCSIINYWQYVIESWCISFLESYFIALLSRDNTFDYETCSVALLLSCPVSMCLLFIPYWMALWEKPLFSRFLNYWYLGEVHFVPGVGGDREVQCLTE